MLSHDPRLNRNNIALQNVRINSWGLLRKKAILWILIDR